MSSIMSILSLSAVALFATSTNAHMIMGSPPPYGSPDNSPLVADGSNFPCKATSNAGATVTSMSIGEQQPLWFIGSAVHGGGSCQISLTTDMPATKSSSWMVIHSIEGGCPAKNTAGNDAAGQSGGSNYTYTIPEGITPGSYTLAWTWFNKIGNREMYMNCASIKVNAGSSKRALSLNETLGAPQLSKHNATSSFPGMFIANIPTTDCETADSQDVEFPNPGSSVEKDGSGTLTAPTGPKCNVAAGGGAASSSGSNSTVPAAGSASSGSAGSGSSGSGSSGSDSSGSASSGSAASGSSGSGSGSSASGSSGSGSSGGSSAGSYGAASAAPSMAASGAPAAAAAASVAPSVAPPLAAGASPSAAAASPAAAAAAPSSPAAAAAPSSAPAAMGNSSSSSSSSSSSTSSTGTCSSAGQSVCSPDGTQIGTCTSSLTVTWIPVAAGTKCVGGYQVFAKRSGPKFQQGYVRRSNALGNW